MEVIKNKHTGLFQKFSSLKYGGKGAGGVLNDKDVSILRTLRDDSNFIKKKLASIENQLQMNSEYNECDCPFFLSYKNII
jgi:hypothetical protein